MFDLGLGGGIQQIRRILQKEPEKLQLAKEMLQSEHPEVAKVNKVEYFSFSSFDFAFFVLKR